MRRVERPCCIDIDGSSLVNDLCYKRIEIQQGISIGSPTRIISSRALKYISLCRVNELGQAELRSAWKRLQFDIQFGEKLVRGLRTLIVRADAK